MQHSIVRYQDLNPEIRIDAEYYRREILNRLNVLDQRNKDDLGNLVSFVIGPFGSTVTVDQYVESSQYRYVRNKDISDFRIADNELALIPKDVYDALPRFHIRENDLLITVVGTLGKVAFATRKDTRSIFSCKSTIIRAGGINPYFLLTYLNSGTGKLFSLRGKRGAIQEGLNLTDLQSIPVFIPTTGFQLIIEEIIKESFACIDKSECLFKAIQTLLLSELSLANWQPQHRLTFVKSYSDTQQAGRIDAEHFQPKYDDIVDAIEGYAGGWDTLGSLVHVKDMSYKPEDTIEYRYIELANIGNNGEITDCLVEEGQDLPSRARRKVAKGDVIVSSIEGSLNRIALIGQEYDQALCSTGFHVLNSQELNSETLLVLMKSVVGQLQLKKGCSGTILTAISRDELKKLILPVIPSDKQAHIKQRVTESFSLRKQSKHLLECAKRAVEIAIEQDEQIAIDWLKSETMEGPNVGTTEWKN